MTSISFASKPILARTVFGESEWMSPSKTSRLDGSRPASRLWRMVSQKAFSFSMQATTSNIPVLARPMSSPIPPENRDMTLNFFTCSPCHMTRERLRNKRPHLKQNTIRRRARVNPDAPSPVNRRPGAWAGRRRRAPRRPRGCAGRRRGPRSSPRCRRSTSAAQGEGARPPRRRPRQASRGGGR